MRGVIELPREANMAVEKTIIMRGTRRSNDILGWAAPTMDVPASRQGRTQGAAEHGVQVTAASVRRRIKE